MSDSLDNYYGRAVALCEAGKFAAALSEWREAAGAHPEWADEYGPAYLHVRHGYLLLAQAYHDRGAPRPARAQFEAALRAQPAHAYALRCLASIQWRQGGRRGAVETLKAAIAAEPTYAPGYERLARGQARLLQWRACFRTVRAMDTMLYAEGREEEVDESVRQGLPYIAALLVVVVGMVLLWHLARRKPA